jgi:DNA-binding MarR family transcriptional regulator
VTSGALEHDANVFGALALMVADRMSDVLTAPGEPLSAAAALSALYQFLDRPTIDLLHRVIGLTPSGTVRLVDKLEGAGLVERSPGAHDKRSVTVSLTPRGEHAARRVSAARANVLRDALATLTPDEQRTFEQLSSKLLVALMRPPGAERWMCRLCDTTDCDRAGGRCPVYNAALAKYGPDQKP